MNNESMTCKKQQSILEGEIDLLMGEVLRVNRLVNNIFDILRPSPPCEVSCEQTPANTVADSLRDIRTFAEGTREQLEGIAKCLDEQLGGLKLEY